MSKDFSIQDIKSRIIKDSKGISNYIGVYIEEMDWLVSQAEKIERLEKERNELLEDNKRLIETSKKQLGQAEKLDSYVCPNCKGEETYSINDFLSRGIEFRECEECNCKYRVHFSTVITKIEIENN